MPQSTKDAQFFDIGLKEPSAITGDAITQRKNLVAVIQEKAKESTYPEAFSHIMEETAYTWFNRLIAIRFMEVNDYLSARVLSSKTSEKIEPDLVTSPFDSDLTFSEDESRQIVDLKMNNQTDDLFRMLFLKECNALNEPLPMLFEKSPIIRNSCLPSPFLTGTASSGISSMISPKTISGTRCRLSAGSISITIQSRRTKSLPVRAVKNKERRHPGRYSIVYAGLDCPLHGRKFPGTVVDRRPSQ